MSTATKLAFLAASLLMVGAATLSAQAIKKYVTPDGKTIYSDVPISGAREIGRVGPPPKVDPEARRQAQEAANRDAERAQGTVRRADRQSSQQARIQAAEKQLEEARRALEGGKEPLPGERQGLAGGGTRLTEAYFERQRANERAVERAQQELDAALAER